MAFGGRVAGLKIELEINGEKVNKYLTTAAREVNKVEKSLKDLEKSLKLNPTSTELLTQKQQLLGQAIEKTGKYLKDLRDKYAELSSVSDPTEKQKNQMMNLQREISDAEQKLKSLKKELISFGTVGAQQIQAVGKMIQDFGNNLSSWGSHISSMGMQLERLGAPIQAAFGFGAQQGMEFEKGMSAVQAVTNATTEDMEKLETAAREMARQTVFSAGETSEALYYMGLAGWNATESTEALEGVLDLAAAGQVDLGRASSIVVDGMNAMGYAADGYTKGVKNATHFSNVMAAAMSNSNTTVDLLGESFKYAAPLAGSLNYSIEDLTLGLGLMASSGIKGSQAGTGLRMAFKNMASPTAAQAKLMQEFNLTMEDGYGNALPLRDVIVQLREKFGGLNLELLDAEGNLKTGEQLMEEYGDSLPSTQMEKFRAIAEIVGVRALPGILGMVNATEEDFNQLAGAIDTADDSFVRLDGKIYPLTEAIEQFGEEAVLSSGEVVGAAEAMREIQLDNLQGDLTLLKDNFADLGIAIYEDVSPYLRDFVDWLGELIEKFRGLSPETKRTILIVAGIVAALGPVLVIIGQVAMGIGALISLFGSIISGIGSIIGFIGALVGAVGALPVIIGGIVIALIAFIVTHWEEFKETMSMLWESIKEFAIALWEGIKNTFIEAWQQISDIFSGIAETIQEKWQAFKDKVIEIVEAIRTKFEEWRQKVAEIVEGVRQKWAEFREKLAGIVEGIKQKVEDMKERIKEKFDAIREKIENLKQKWEDLKQKIIDIKESVLQKIEDFKESIRKKFEKIQEFMEDPIGSAKKFIDEKIQAIKDLFPLSIGKIFSNFKLPHIETTWKKIGGLVDIPTFSISWYDKAMKNGMLLNGATIFGYNNGQFLGGGESGKEWIVGHNSLQSMIKNAVGSNGLTPEVIYNAVVAGMTAANVEVYMDSAKVTKQVTKTITQGQAAMNRYYGV